MITEFQILQLRKRLEFEVAGVRCQTTSAWQEIKNRYGFTGSKRLVLKKLDNHLRYFGVLPEPN